MLDFITGRKPDITPAQVVSGIPILADLLHTFGVYDLSAEQVDSLNKTALWAVALLGADAVIRLGRNAAEAKVQAAAVAKDAGPVDPGPLDPAAELPPGP